MSNLREQLREIAESYAIARGYSLLRFLGDGNDGAVWESDQQTAIKVVERRNSFVRERDAYIRLQELAIVDLERFSIPWLVRFDDSKQVVEMTVVSAPCILDSAKAYVDYPSDFSEEVLREWQDAIRDYFEDDWHKVSDLLERLRSIGVYYFDAKPGNIRL